MIDGRFRDYDKNDWEKENGGISKFGIYLFDDVKRRIPRLTAEGEEIEKRIPPVKRWKSGFIRMDLYARKICL